MQVTKWLQHMREAGLVGLTWLLKNSLSLSMLSINLSKKSQRQSNSPDLGCVGHRALWVVPICPGQQPSHAVCPGRTQCDIHRTSCVWHLQRSGAGILCQGLVHKEHRIRMVELKRTLKVIYFQHCATYRAVGTQGTQVLRAVDIVPQGLALLTLCCFSCSLQPQKQTL